MSRRAFSLIELVVVITILGVLAAVAAPKLLGTSATAKDNGVRTTLSVVRDAIGLYAAEHGGTLPGGETNSEAVFKADLAPYLRTEFPTCPVGAMNDEVKISNSSAALVGLASPTKGWAYSRKTGEFIVNFSGVSTDGATPYDRF